MNFKNQLRHYLKARGLTASALARQAGVPKQSISDWLGGTAPRRVDHLKKVADALEVSLDHLCFGNGDVDAPPTTDLGGLIGDHWVGGLFEVRLRRVKR